MNVECPFSRGTRGAEGLRRATICEIVLRIGNKWRALRPSF